MPHPLLKLRQCHIGILYGHFGKPPLNLFMGEDGEPFVYSDASRHMIPTRSTTGAGFNIKKRRLLL
jgi:hypothetical protein